MAESLKKGSPASDLQKRGMLVVDDKLVQLALTDTGNTTPDGVPIYKMDVEAALEVGDIQIGAVEIKDHTDAQRAGVDATLLSLAVHLRKIMDSADNEALVNAALSALQVDVKTPLSGYESGPDAFVWIPGARGGYKSYEDTSFVAAESPRVLDVNTDLGRNGKDGYITVDGPGYLLVEISADGVVYGDQFTLKNGEVFSLRGYDSDSIRLTHSGTDSAYRIVVQ